MKRKIFCMLICIMSAILLSSSVYAAETSEYNVPELGMAVSMPSDYVVFTRNVSDDDPNLSAYGLTKDSILSLMNERNIYLNAWDKTVSQEIIVTMTKVDTADFSKYNDIDLFSLVMGLKDEYQKNGVTLMNSDFYNQSQAKFIKMFISLPNGDSTIYGLQYYTVYANKAISITLRSYSGQITSEQESTMKEIVDSIKFDATPDTATVVSTDSFIYTDPNTQTIFLVPAYWIQAPTYESTKYTNVKFTSLKDELTYILYGSTDIWGNMSQSKQNEKNRSEFNNSSVSKADIADICGVTSDDISMVTVGAREYFKAKTTSDAGTLTSLMYVENGYLYTFQFNGSEDNEYYKDFETMLLSAKNKNIAVNETSGETSSQTASDITSEATKQIATNKNSNDSSLPSPLSFGNILLSLLLTIVVYSLPIIVYRYGYKKAPVSKKKGKKITIIYGICAFIVMTGIIVALGGSGSSGGAILLWSYINYSMLTKGYVEETPAMSTALPTQNSYYYNASQVKPDPAPIVSSPSNNTQNSTINRVETEENKIVPSVAKTKCCSKCGHDIMPREKYCGNCGAKVE